MRIQRLEKPLRHPGKCCVCGGTDKPVVDILLEVQRYGRIYFCEDCVRELALAIGYVPASELRMVYPPLDEIEKAQKRIEDGLESNLTNISSLYASTIADLRASVLPQFSAPETTENGDERSIRISKRDSEVSGQDASSLVHERSDGVPSRPSNEPGSVFSFRD